VSTHIRRARTAAAGRWTDGLGHGHIYRDYMENTVLVLSDVRLRCFSLPMAYDLPKVKYGNQPENLISGAVDPLYRL